MSELIAWSMDPEQTFKFKTTNNVTNQSCMICNALACGSIQDLQIIQDCLIPVKEANTEKHFKVASGIAIDCMKGQVLNHLI